jgi:hypothetical protein
MLILMALFSLFHLFLTIRCTGEDDFKGRKHFGVHLMGLEHILMLLKKF